MIIKDIQEIHGAFSIECDRFCDNRGYFQEVFSKKKYSYIPTALQTNVSVSKKNVIRGLHVAPFSKLCTCIKGKLFDVIIDTRFYSPTYKNWFGMWLDEENCKQLYIPAGCGHGFFAAKDDTMLLYQQDGFYNSDFEKEINWRDTTFSVDWPNSKKYILSERDQNAPFFTG